MRFLADEGYDFAAVRALRAHGHDVLAVSKMELALEENRILLTEDTEFGWLMFAGRTDSPSVVLIRFPVSARSSLAEAVLKLVDEHTSQLVGPSWSYGRGRPE